VSQHALTAGASALPAPPADGVALKCQCAELWAHPAAQLLLGEALRPGGVELTARLLDAAGLHDGAIVVDIGCGPGATLELLANRGLRPVGVDYSPTLACESASRRGVSVSVGDSERLGLRQGVADALTMECVLSAFPDKHAALFEARRVLAPGGRLLLSDVTVAETLPEPLDSALGWVACVAGALRPKAYLALLEETGFAVEETWDEQASLLAMIAKARRRIALLRGASGVGMLPSLEEFVGPDMAEIGRTLFGHDDLAEAGSTLLNQATDAIGARSMGYLAVVARAT
jgi:SAM-dependent methyltransferase